MAAVYKLTGLSRLFPNSPRFARYHLTFLVLLVPVCVLGGRRKAS